MTFTTRNFKCLNILPNGCFIFSKNLPLKNKKKISLFHKSLNEAILWNKNINTTQIKLSELDNFDILNYRNKFKS